MLYIIAMMAIHRISNLIKLFLTNKDVLTLLWLTAFYSLMEKNVALNCDL
jgi:hypothetical protein